MTGLQLLQEAIATATDWQQDVVMSMDLDQYIAANQVTTPRVVISIGQHEPDPESRVGYGRYERFLEHFSILLGAPQQTQQSPGEVYDVYLAIRDALNGYHNDARAPGRGIEVGPGTPLYESGYAEANLNIVVL